MSYTFYINGVSITCNCECQCPFNNLYRQLEVELNNIKYDNNRKLIIKLNWCYNKRNLFKKITKEILTKCKYTDIHFIKSNNCNYIYYVSFKRNAILEIEEVAFLNNGSTVSIN